MGGVGSALTGGNFWEGVKIGAIVALFNHYMHKLNNPFRQQLKAEFKDTSMKPGDNAVYEDYQRLTEELSTLKNLKTKTGTEFSRNDNLGKDINGKHIGGVKVQINGRKITTFLQYAYTLGHEMLHVFDMQNNFDTVVNIIGRTSLGVRGYDYYKEYRAYMWEYNWGNFDNLNVVWKMLTPYNKFPEATFKVKQYLKQLDASVVNP